MLILFASLVLQRSMLESLFKTDVLEEEEWTDDDCVFMYVFSFLHGVI